MATITRSCVLNTCYNTFTVTAQSNPKKFCSRSCSTTSNNLLSPRRILTKACKTCPTLVKSNRIYCNPCFAATSTLNRPIGEITRNATSQVNSQLRSLARSVYKKSGMPYVCAHCAYDKHVEICHIKDLFQFTPETLASETCDMENLVPLCSNCHWEFDHGYLGIFFTVKPVKPTKQGNPIWAERAKHGIITHVMINTLETYT